jgi:hypothetical protein
MNALIYILLSIVLLFSGCKTTKQAIKTDTNIKETVQLAILEEKTEKTQEENKELRADHTEVDEQETEKTTIVKLSEPDEQNKQYIQEIIFTERDKHIITTAISTIENDVQRLIDKTTVYADNSKSEADYKSVTDEKIKEKTRLPAWLYWIVGAGGLSLFFGVYKFFKNPL